MWRQNVLETNMHPQDIKGRAMRSPYYICDSTLSRQEQDLQLVVWNFQTTEWQGSTCIMIRNLLLSCKGTLTHTIFYPSTTMTMSAQSQRCCGSEMQTIFLGSSRTLPVEKDLVLQDKWSADNVKDVANVAELLSIFNSKSQFDQRISDVMLIQEGSVMAEHKNFIRLALNHNVRTLYRQTP